MAKSLHLRCGLVAGLLLAMGFVRYLGDIPQDVLTSHAIREAPLHWNPTRLSRIVDCKEREVCGKASRRLGRHNAFPRNGSRNNAIQPKLIVNEIHAYP